MKYRKMKTTTLLTAAIILCASCSYNHADDSRNEDKASEVSSTAETGTLCVADTPAISESYVEQLDTIVNSFGLTIYIPQDCVMQYVFSPDIPDGTIQNQMYVAAAAFTGVGWEDGFDHKLIAGDHVARLSWETLDAKRYRGYPCKRNTGAFVYYNGQYKFLYKVYSLELDSAAIHQGIGFGQEMITHEGAKVPTIRRAGNVNQFRALCEWHNDLCVIESKEDIAFGDFSDCLGKLSVSEALYLDMGGWNYSWYRNKYGEVIHTFPEGRERLTNAIVFTGAN